MVLLVGFLSQTIGPNDVSKPGVEAALDIQYLMGITHNIRTWIWSTAGLNEFNQEPFMEWLHNVTSSPESEASRVSSVFLSRDLTCTSLPSSPSRFCAFVVAHSSLRLLHQLPGSRGHSWS